MAPTAWHLIALKSDVTEKDFLSVLRDLSPADRPFFVGRCQHWVHAPRMSSDALTGSDNTMKKWDYFIINKTSEKSPLTLPQGLQSKLEDVWSITANVDDAQLANHSSAHRARLAAAAPDLPGGWSPIDHSGLDAAIPPPDLELSLATASYPLGARTDSEQKPTTLKHFTRDLGARHSGPVNMLNLLSYLPGQRPQYMKYRAVFAESVGSKYGGEGFFVGPSPTDWTSKDDEIDSEAGWDDVAVVHYPSIWHFSKMVDDPGYVDADRRFKQGVLRDNPILCCIEVDVGYSN